MIILYGSLAASGANNPSNLSNREFLIHFDSIEIRWLRLRYSIFIKEAAYRLFLSHIAWNHHVASSLYFPGPYKVQIPRLSRTLLGSAKSPESFHKAKVQ